MRMDLTVAVVVAAAFFFSGCGGQNEGNSACGAPGSHSDVDASGTCLCDSGFTWANPDATDDYRCVANSTQSCGQGYELQDGACVPASSCVPQCEGPSCGLDGCGSYCGTCSQGYVCVAGSCSQACQPNCDGVSCGPDGCGGSCGSCAGGKSCEDGQCVAPPCVPSCNSRACGSDGCGGNCGECTSGEVCGGGGTAGVCATCTQEGYETDLVDENAYSMGTIGFAVDENGVGHIAYTDADTDQLIYAQNAGGAWVKTPIAEGSDIQLYVSLALDPNGDVHVSFTRGDPSVLWYATNKSGSFVAEQVATVGSGFQRNAIAADAAGFAHLVFRDWPSAVGKRLRYATNKSGSWLVGTIERNASDDELPAIAAGQDGTIHVSYRKGGKLMHAHNESGAWQLEEVAAASSASVNWGRNTAIAVDTVGKVHIAYTNSDTAVRYATNASGSFVDELVAQVTTYDGIGLDGAGGVGIAVDSHGFAHVSYAALPSGYGYFLNYATNQSGSWQQEIFNMTGASRDRTIPVVDADGRVHIGYNAYAYPYDPRVRRQKCPQAAPGVRLTPRAVPPAPVPGAVACVDCVRALLAMGTADGVRLAWQPVEGASGYKVYLAKDAPPSMDSYAKAAEASGTEHTFSGLTPGEVYFGVVTVITGSGESAESLPVSARPIGEVPGVSVQRVADPAFGGWAQVIGNAGDVNGDGFEDLLVGDGDHGSGKGRVELYYGNANGVFSDAAWTADGESGTSLGIAVGTVGDVNGDGYDDFAVSDKSGIRIYHGSSTGPAATPARTINQSGLGTYGAELPAGHGDFNGDGYDDVVVGAPWARRDSQNAYGKVSVYFGSASGISSTAGWSKTYDSEWKDNDWGGTVAGAGDVNGDGYDDLLAGSSSYSTYSNLSAGSLLLFLGGEGGLADTPAWSKSGSSFESYFGETVAPLGDLDGDGFDDVAIGVPSYSDPSVQVFHGTDAATGLLTAPSPTIDAAGRKSFGRALWSGFDLLSDGTLDVAVSGAYHVALFSATPTGIDTSPVWSWDLDPNGNPYLRGMVAGRFASGPVTVLAFGVSDYYGTQRWIHMWQATPGAEGVGVDAGVVQEGFVGTPIHLVAASLQRGAQGTYSCTVDFGDGSTQETLSFCSDQDVQALEHYYWRPGDYTVSLTAAGGAERSVALTTVSIAE